MTKRNASELDWVTVDETSLSPALAKRLAEIRDIAKEHADAKRAFEGQFVAGAHKIGSLDEGYSLAFAYRFNKL